MIWNTTTLGQSTDLANRDLTLTWGQHQTWPLLPWLDLFYTKKKMYDVTGVIWPYSSFSSITPDQTELERRERHQCLKNELPSQMIYKTTALGQGTDLASRDQTLPWGQRVTGPFLNKKYIIRCSLTSQTRWYHNVCYAIIYVEVIR